MSILIKGLKTPEGCGECKMRFLADPNYVCCGVTDRIPKIVAKYDNSKIDLDRRTKSIESVKRPEWCPLVELPDHGDLIDRDALMARYAEEVKPSNNSDFMRPPRWNDAVQLTELAPVVIPAERSEE